MVFCVAQVSTSASPIDADVNLSVLASNAWSDGWTGADISAVVKEAALAVSSIAAHSIMRSQVSILYPFCRRLYDGP